jgi:hypothetical protein
LFLVVILLVRGFPLLFLSRVGRGRVGLMLWGFSLPLRVFMFRVRPLVLLLLLLAL